MRDAVDPGSCRDLFRLGEPVSMLPLEIVVRHVEQYFALTIGITGREFEVSPTDMHMGHQAEQFDVFVNHR